MKYERILQNSDMVSAREHARLFLHRPTLYSLRSHSISSGVHQRLYFFYFSGIRGSISGSPILGTTMIPLYSNFKAVQRAGFSDLPTKRRLRSRITLMSRLKPQICSTCAFVANRDLRTLALPVRTSSPTLRLQPWTWFPMQRHHAQGQKLVAIID